MSDRPRITVKHTTGATRRPMGFTPPTQPDTPAVTISVDFPLHHHDAALQALDQAVEHVRSQITQEDQP